MASTFNLKKLASHAFRSRMVRFHEFAEIYTPAVKRRGDNLKGAIKEKLEQAYKSELARKVRVAKGFYTLEMAPPSYNDIQKMQQDLLLFKEFMQTGCYKYLTVKQAWLLFLVGLEISLWFYLGETIGKMHIVGYKV